MSKVKVGLNPVAEQLSKAGLGVWTLDTRLVQYGVDSPHLRKHYSHKGLSLDACSLWRRFYGPGVYLTNRIIEGEIPDQMVSKAALILFEDGVLEMHSEYHFFLKEWPREVPRFNWSKHYSARIGSAEQDRYIDSLINDLIENLGPALDCLARLMEHSTD